MKKKFAQRQIPTLLGLAILLLSLAGGILAIGTGGGVFAPRATPQTTPKNIKTTNIKDNGFTVSFLTDEATTGFIKYGTSPTDLKFQASDDRDQLSGNVGQFSSHYITVRELQPQTTYYYTLGTASVPKFDNNGAPFTATTAPKGGVPTAAKTAYGNVLSPSGSPGEGSIVYMTLPGVAELSALVKASGSWAIPLSNARTADLSAYATIQPSDMTSIFAQGQLLSQTTQTQVPISETQPVKTLTLGGGSSAATSTETVSSTQSITNPSPTLAPSPVLDETTLAPAAAQVADTVDLTLDGQTTVETSQPIIKGTAPPNTIITIEVHSTTQITSQVTTDANGNFILPLSQGDTALEPGEHTVTVSYLDPTTGQQQTQTRTFVVSGTSVESQLLAQATTGQNSPYGSGNPFTIPSPSPSPIVTSTASASVSATPVATDEGRVAMPATNSAVPKSGSVGTTIALIGGGLILIVSGVWSFHQARPEHAAVDDAEFQLEDPSELA